MNLPSPDPMPDLPELPSLTALEPFGWIFSPGLLSPEAISLEAAQLAAGVPAGGLAGAETSAMTGLYTEKGRYRQEQGGRRVTLYAEHPVWVISIVPKEIARSSDQVLTAESCSRYTVVDARTGQPITQFLRLHEPRELGLLDLHAPLATAVLTRDGAVTAATAGEERVLTGLPTTVEYGSRWRLIPGFVQVTDVWRVTFDTSSLPPLSPTADPEVAWIVMVDDKAGHRWFSAALQGSPTPDEREV